MTKRLFIGIPMQADDSHPFNELIERQESHQSLRWVPAKNWHITLLFLGNVEDYMVEKMVGQIEKVALNVVPFQLEFSHFTVSPKRNPYMIWAQFRQNIHFEQLSKQLAGALNVRLDHTPLAHTTLARFKTGFPYQNIDLNGVANFTLHIDQICLYESKLQIQGAEYKIIKPFLFNK